MAGPYVKNGYVSHRHANFGSILRTIYTILDIPPVNQYDATATLLSDFFVAQPHKMAYLAKPHDARIFNPQLSLKKYQRNFNWRSVDQGLKMDDERDMRLQFYERN
jgi:hypothetical protein